MRLPQDRILHIDTELAGDEVRIVAEWQGELVRCKDCIHQEECEQIVVFDIHVDEVQGHRADYCSYGERREL